MFIRSHICRVKKAPIEVKSEQGAINACTSDKQTESKLIRSHIWRVKKGSN